MDCIQVYGIEKCKWLVNKIKKNLTDLCVICFVCAILFLFQPKSHFDSHSMSKTPQNLFGKFCDKKKYNYIRKSRRNAEFLNLKMFVFCLQIQKINMYPIKNYRNSTTLVSNGIFYSKSWQKSVSPGFFIFLFCVNSFDLFCVCDFVFNLTQITFRFTFKA